MMAYKWCVVPLCKNTSIYSPHKLFVSVPTNPKRRIMWLQLARRDPKSISSKTNVFMCEDHFDMEKDTINYMKYKMGFSQKILLSDGAVPTKFHCQEDRKRHMMSDAGSSQEVFLKRQRIDLVTEYLQTQDAIKTHTESLQKDDDMIQEIIEPEEMEKLTMCRICLIENVRMHCIINTRLEEIYEKLTALPFETKDRRPIQICYICFAKLQNCYQLWVSCLQSEKMFTQIMVNFGFQTSQLQNSNTLKIMHPVINIDVEPGTLSDFNDGNDNDEEPSTDPLETVDLQVKEEYVEGDPVLKKRKPNELGKNPHTTKCFTEQKKGLKFKRNSKPIPTAKTKNTTDFSRKSNKSKDKCYKCDICDVSYRSRFDLTLHTRKHTGVKPYKCDICDQAFRRKSSLGIHVVRHTSEKKYKCETCNKYFLFSSNLKRHVRRHTGERPYECDLCKRCFTEKGSLISHMRVHTGEKPFKCDICNRSFSVKTALKLHSGVHTDKTPYKCDLCNKSFKLEQILRNHKRAYHSDNPNKCHVCSKFFTSKSSLDNHVRVHTGEKPFECDICKKRFNRNFALTRHFVFTHTYSPGVNS